MNHISSSFWHTLCRLIFSISLSIITIFAIAAPPKFTQVTPGKTLTFPYDFGAHPSFRTEWWYVTGWLETPDKKPLGFQITFFRSATDTDADNPSQFAPKQLIIAHAALSDPSVGKLLLDQKIARTGFGLSYTKEGDTDVKLDNWTFKRQADGRYQATIKTRDFSFDLQLTPTQATMLQGERGYSQKGPQPQQASYYYSQPQLQVTGNIIRDKKTTKISGNAWLDHEWSTHILDAKTSGWDWLGANLDDGGALIAFQLRNKDGSPYWSHAALRDKAGSVTHFTPEQTHFTPLRQWHSPHTDVSYPIAMQVQTDKTVWQLMPLQDDQEVDARLSVGAIYWEGAVHVMRDGKAAGRGYLELTGYWKSLKF